MLAEGFDGYQTKPIALKDFLGEVERVLKVRSQCEKTGKRFSRKGAKTPRSERTKSGELFTCGFAPLREISDSRTPYP